MLAKVDELELRRLATSRSNGCRRGLLEPGEITFCCHLPEEILDRRSEHPNVFVRHKFWTDPSSLDIEASTLAGNLPTVPSTLVYADLLASGEPRQRDAALILKEHDERLVRIFRP